MHPQSPQPPLLTLLTRTRIDTGRWWRRAPVHLTLTETELTLHASGPRPFTASAPLADCRASRYHHATGELVLEPAESLPIRHLRIPPQDALGVLRILKSPTTPAPVC